MEVILDTNFIISCIIKKIDFISQLEEQGFRVVVPKEVMQEMKDLKLKKTSHEERTAINAAFEIIEKRKVKKMSVGKKGKVDDMLIKKGQEGFYIATLDSGIKNKVPNKVVILNSKASVGIG